MQDFLKEWKIYLLFVIFYLILMPQSYDYSVLWTIHFSWNRKEAFLIILQVTD